MSQVRSRRFNTAFSVVVLMACVCTIPQLAVANPVVPSATLAALADRFVDTRMDLNPLIGTMITGDVRYENKFVNSLTPAFRAKERVLFIDTLNALKKIDAKDLSGQDRLTRAVLEYQARQGLDTANYDFHLTPINQFRSMPLTLVQLASTKGAQPFRTVANFDNFLQRLDGFPEWVDSAIMNMREGMAKGVVLPKVLVARVLPQLKSQMVSDPVSSGFYVPVKNFPPAFSDADRVRLTSAYRQAVEEKITPAIIKLHGFIANEYLPKCVDAAGLGATPNGAAKYAFKVREQTTTSMTPTQIHQLGLREVARIRGEMEKVRTQVGFSGDLNTFLASLVRNPLLTPFKTEEEVIEAYRKIQQRVEPTLDKLFSRRPRSLLEIRPEPEITRATAAAHYNVGTIDGSRPGVFYAPVRNPATYATPNMTALFLHEGLPGHHYEVSLKLESDLPRFRRYGWFPAYGEGWALYAESLGGVLGVYDDPYQNLGRLRSEMHRAIRLVVDTGLHAKGWSRERAVAYMLENNGGNEADVVQEIERYMAIPGQALSYKIGEQKILELRLRAEKKLGSRFDIRVFHDEILNGGGLPLAVLEEKIVRWLAQQRQVKP